MSRGIVQSLIRETGNIGQLLDRHGWDFHHSIAKEYGSVVKIGGLFGVRHTSLNEQLEETDLQSPAPETLVVRLRPISTPAHPPG